MTETDLAAIRDAIRRHQRTEVHDVARVKPMSIPAKSGGSRAGREFTAGELVAVAQWSAPQRPAPDTGTAAKQQMALGLARFVGRSARQRRESD